MPSRALFGAMAFAVAFGGAVLNAQEIGQPATERDSGLASPPLQSTPANEPNSSPEQDPIDLLPAIQGIESAIRDLMLQEDARERQRQLDHEQRDLYAQEAMALWAERMFWATLASVGLTAVGIWLIGRTLHHTKIASKHAGTAAEHAGIAAKHAGEAVTQAERGANAAFDAVRVTENTAQKQLRAYVLVKRTGFAHDPTTGRYLLYADVYNDGQTPAYNLRMTAGIRLMPEQKEQGLTPHEPMEKSDSTVGPRSHVTVVTPAPTSQEWEQIGARIENGSILYLIGRITYRDVFERDQFTNFRYRVRGRLDFDVQGLEVAPEGNEYS